MSQQTTMSFPNERVVALARVEEPRIVSLALKDKDVLTMLIDSGVTFDQFFHPDMSALFQITARYYDEHGGLMTRQAFHSLLLRGAAEETVARMRSLYDQTYAEVTSRDDVPALIRGFQDRYVQASTYAVLTRYHDLLLHAVSGQREMVAAIQRDISEVTMPRDASFNRLYALEEVLRDKVMPEIYERRDNPAKFRGMLTGWGCVDDDFHGFQKGRYMIITATEGGGKSTFMYNMARRFAMRGNYVVYITIESNAQQVTERLLTIHSNVNQNRIAEGGSDQTKGLPPSIIAALERARDDIVSKASGFGKYFHVAQALEGTSRKALCRMVDRHRSYAPVDIVFVDYLQVIAPDKNFPTRPDKEIANVSDGLRGWGRQNNYFVVTAQQIKTDKSKKLQEAGGDDIDKVVITKADTSGSKELVGAADHMLSILVLPTRDKIRVGNMKNRFGADHKTYDLSFDPNSGRIDNLPDADRYSKVASQVARAPDASVDDIMGQLDLPQQASVPETPPDDPAKPAAGTGDKTGIERMQDRNPMEEAREFVEEFGGETGAL